MVRQRLAKPSPRKGLAGSSPVPSAMMLTGFKKGVILK